MVRFAPTVHGAGDHGFVAVLVSIAREKGVSGFIANGTQRWSAVHRLDAGNLVRRVVEGAPAGSIWHSVAEEGVPTRDIAEAIGRGLGLPVVSIDPGDAAEHFGWIGMFLGVDAPASNERTREKLGWDPSNPGLLADLDAGHYFA